MEFLENIIPRKYNNPVTIGLICLVAVSVAIIIYMYMKSDVPTPPPQPQPSPQHPSPTQAPPLTETFVNTGKPALVLFWGDWCGHSVNMKPAWDKVASILNENGAIEALDFETKRNADVVDIAMKKLPNFEGFPDIRFFPGGFDLNAQSIKFTDNRTEDAMLKFAYSSAGNL